MDIHTKHTTRRRDTINLEERESEKEKKKGKWDEEFLKENESQRKTEK